MAEEVTLGVYTFEKETPGTYRFQQDVDGRKQTIYVPKTKFAGQERPNSFEVILRPVS